MKTATQKLQTLLFCLITCLIIFVFYLHTLNYSWKFFDESIIYGESILPIPNSIQEIIETIKLFGINTHIVSSSPIYSDIVNIRGTSIDVIFHLFI